MSWVLLVNKAIWKLTCPLIEKKNSNKYFLTIFADKNSLNLGLPTTSVRINGILIFIDYTVKHDLCPWVVTVISYLLTPIKYEKYLIFLLDFAFVTRIMIYLEFTYSHWKNWWMWTYSFTQSKNKMTYDSKVAVIYSRITQEDSRSRKVETKRHIIQK